MLKTEITESVKCEFCELNLKVFLISCFILMCISRTGTHSDLF